jgi:hypothetical protein
MSLRALTLRSLARRDPDEEEANQADGKLGGRTSRRSQLGTRRGAAQRRRKDGLGGAAAVQVPRGRDGRKK